MMRRVHVVTIRRLMHFGITEPMPIDLLRSVTRVVAFSLLYSCLTVVSATAQDVQRQIENDVWIPFLAASNAFDADRYLAVQSKDLVRVSVDAKQVYGFARYEAEIRDGFRRARERGIVRVSEMRFLERLASGDLAHETGYFRSRVTLANGEVRVRYTRFEMVLRREAGTWKLLLDKDTSEGGAITEAMFRAAAPMKEAAVKDDS